jgi:kinesin family member 6/9
MHFTDIFDCEASQEDIFRSIGQGVVDECLKGYNCTIFAYGQTGSGKTYTMSGAESWRLRGIIPRTFSYIFQQYAQNPNAVYNTYVSYLEIYNETGFDLLDRKHAETPFENWNKVQIILIFYNFGCRFRCFRMILPIFI